MAFAHSINSAGRRHDLVAHLRAVAESAAAFATGQSASELAYYAGLWHDVGKFHPTFQDYLLHCEAHPAARGHGPDHKAAGAQLAAESNLNLLGLVLQGHHGGLVAASTHRGWLDEKRHGSAIAEAIGLARQALPDLNPVSNLQPPDFVLKDGLAAEMYLRLVFSALVDADFLDTERHFKAEQPIARGSILEPADLLPRLVAHRERLAALVERSTVNDVRNAVYEQCIVAAEGETGFYRLTVPTGGGKTLSAMAFALHHADRHALERVIVAVPFISITEQTAGAYRDIFGAHPNVVLEHHSMAEWEDEADGDFHSGPVWDRLAAENWDAPVIVTTTVQLFESLFSNRTSRVRKLHRLAHSVIILDEAQALPSRLLKPVLDGLRQLVEHYGATVVISTATQPAFDAIPVFRDVQAREIVPEPVRYFEALRRVSYEWRTEAPLSVEEVAALLREEPRALAVYNTKRDALALLDALGLRSRPAKAMADGWEEALATTLTEAEALHLSTLLCGAHRRDVLAAIRSRLATGETCRVVSTQVIEAGVDLDFPCVLRALAPLDSIIQAAGRCNREGRLAEPGRVIVFQPEGAGMPAGAYRTGADVTASLLRAGDLDPDSPEAARRYFTRLFDSVDTDAERIQEKRRVLNYPDVARDFQMIDDDTYSLVVTDYGSREERERLEQDIEELRRGTPRARELRRRLQPYVVALRTRQVRRLPAGLVEELRPGYGLWRGGYDAVRGIVLRDVEPDALVI